MKRNTKNPKTLDRTDRRILECLQADGRISNVQLARKVNLTPTPCIERVKRLERQGWRSRRTMRSRILALCALLVAVGLVPGAAAQEQDGPTLELSLDDAVERALDGNVDIAVSRYDPEIAALSVVSAEGFYDPFLFARVDHDSTDTKGTNFFSGGRRL